MLKILPLYLLCLVPLLANAKEWAFDVYLDQTKMGEHTFKLDDTNELVSDAQFKVKILFVNAYQYQHHAVEQWQDGCLNALEAETIENGVTSQIKGHLAEPNFEVSDGQKNTKLPECTMTFAYWSPKILTQTKLLNPQNAEWLDTRVQKMGSETIEVKGKPTETIHYKLNASLLGKPKLNIDLWYRASDGEWVALKSLTPEHYSINYRLK